MTELTWDAPGDRYFETGVDRGVFYPQNAAGVAWNGLVTVKESVENTGQSTYYVDGQKQINQLNLGDFAATIEAITYPDEFLPYDGYVDNFSGQNRPRFNFTYRTLLGNDIQGTDPGYRLHLVYNCQVKPTAQTNSSLNTSPSTSLFSWDLSTVPVPVQDARASAHFIVDSTQVDPGIIFAIESYLYGTVSTDPQFPDISQLIGIFEANSVYVIIDNGDGSWTATGPDEAFNIAGSVFSIEWPWVEFLDMDTYKIKSF